jgi:hypothetical protein
MTTTSSSAEHDADSRLRFLAEVADLLWPAPLRTGLGVEGGDVVSEYVLVPDARRPRLLVPADHRRAAAAAVRRHTEPGSNRQRLVLRALSAALATGLGDIVMRHRFRVCADTAGSVDTIETYLRRSVDGDLVISLAIGPAKANRKPVLQLLTPAGGTVGFAKLGVNNLTRTLARAERDALLTLQAASLRHITAPGVVHHGRWNELEVLVLTPLPVWLPRVPPSPERLAAAMLEIAGLGKVGEGPLRGSAYWASLGDRLARLSDDQAAALRAAYERIGGHAGDVPLRFGAWHGDWTPWNMATLRDTLLVWDWERYAPEVPLGFDAVHYAFQGAVVRQGMEPVAAMNDVVERAAELLAPFGVTSSAARLTALLYFADIATRYLQDEQAEAGAALGRLEEWLLPVLVDQIERLHGD